MAGITDPYLRDQLERRRTELNRAISSIPEAEAAASAAPLAELLHEVDSAVQRMDEGTYGICDACHETIEKERLIADPLTRLCLDHLTGEEQRALERDLELASEIQRGLLPQRDLRFRDWRIHYQYQPAGVVSGDYCDVISPASEDGKLIFLLGDVAGKGVAASLLMTHLHAMFRSLAGIGLELDKLLEMANRVFGESTIAGQYATLICGRAGPAGEIEIASAGHFPALLVAKDSVRQIGSTGLPLGMFATSRYTVRRVRLEPHDSLLLYTDGISEASGPSGEEYGIGGLSLAAGQRHGQLPKELVAACMEDVKRYSHGARPTDDQTLMVIQRADSGGASFND
jgi:sigma-B regulation protein RsbU (phosphoserine phosphatase)